MKKKSLKQFLLLLLVLLFFGEAVFAAKVFSQEYVEFNAPPLFLLKADEAAKLRDIVATAPYDKAYKTLMSDADALPGDRSSVSADVI